MVFELVDLEQLGEKALHDFTESVSAEALSRTAVDAQVSTLVTKVEFTYAVAAKLAHREPTMEGTVAIWSKMIAISDQAARELHGIESDSPVTRAASDRILDLRNAAERRRALHA